MSRDSASQEIKTKVTSVVSLKYEREPCSRDVTRPLLITPKTQGGIPAIECEGHRPRPPGGRRPGGLPLPFRTSLLRPTVSMHQRGRTLRVRGPNRPWWEDRSRRNRGRGVRGTDVFKTKRPWGWGVRGRLRDEVTPVRPRGEGENRLNPYPVTRPLANSPRRTRRVPVVPLYTSGTPTTLGIGRLVPSSTDTTRGPLKTLGPCFSCLSCIHLTPTGTKAEDDPSPNS